MNVEYNHVTDLLVEYAERLLKTNKEGTMPIEDMRAMLRALAERNVSELMHIMIKYDA